MSLARSSEVRNGRWWREEHPASFVSARVDKIVSDQQKLREDYQQAYCLYGNEPYGAFGAAGAAGLSQRAPLAWNVIANVVDTVHAEAVSSRPRPMFTTVGGDYELRTRVERLNKFCNGAFDAAEVDEVASDACRDALVYGIGYLKVLSEHGKLVVARPFPWEVLVDHAEGRNRKPRSMYQVSYFDRFALAACYDDSIDLNEDAPADQEDGPSDEGKPTEDAPRARDGELSNAEKMERVLDAPPASSKWALGFAPDANSDVVLVVEAWHLPSAPGAKDGRHVLALYGTDVALVDEEWEDDSFPIIPLRWAGGGWQGQGIAQRLSRIQLDLNYCLQAIQTSHYLLSNARILVEGNSEIVEDAITNEIGGILRYFGTPPQCVTWASVSPEMYQWVNTLKDRGFAEVGVSQMAAQSLKPAGIDSGIALRTYLDTQSKRFIDFSRAYERMHIAVARQMIREMKRLAAADDSYEVVYKSKTHIEKISWRDAYGDMDDGSYEVGCFPVSALPSTPSARLQTLSEMFDKGIIDRDVFLELSDMPDFDTQRDMITAGRELIEKTLEKMIATGDYEYPEAFYPLDLCVKMGGQSYLRAKLTGVSEERLELLRQWIADAQGEIAKAAPPSPPAPPPVDPNAPPVDPGAMPPPDGGMPLDPMAAAA